MKRHRNRTSTALQANHRLADIAQSFPGVPVALITRGPCKGEGGPIVDWQQGNPSTMAVETSPGNVCVANENEAIVRRDVYYKSRRGRNNTAPRKHDLREHSGQYAVGLDRLCVCGHRKGVHVAGDGRGAYECIVHEVEDGHPTCDCEKFKAAPNRKRNSVGGKLPSSNRPGSGDSYRARTLRYAIMDSQQTNHGEFQSLRAAKHSADMMRREGKFVWIVNIRTGKTVKSDRNRTS